MEKATVTVKGQVIIPAKIRRKLGIKKGTRVTFTEKDGEIILRPVSEEYIRNMAGLTATKGKLLRALKKDKERERAL
jgi:AbrB family looped-hinge helix DNA binding protein